MAISCPTCGREADVTSRALESGRLVRCADCGTSWLARSALPDIRSRARIGSDTEISDAIIIDDAPAARKLSRPALPPPSRPAPVSSRRSPMTRLGMLATGGIALVAILAVGLFGAPIVAALPQKAGETIAAKGLEFRGVRSETVIVGGAKTLVVEGEIVNTRGESLDLPAVRIALKTIDGKDVTAWQMQPASSRLAAGQAISFRSARAAPPSSATQVTLSLVD